MRRGAGADAAENAFLARQLPGHGERIVVVHLDHFVDDAEVQHVGHEARADALNLVPAGLQRLSLHLLRDDRAGDRLHRNRLERRFALLDDFADAGDGAAGADAGDEDVDLAVGVAPELFRCGLAMDLGIGRVLELLRHERIRNGPEHLFRLGDRAVHALLARREHDLGAERLQQPAALEAHCLGHGDNKAVTLGGTGEGQTDAGVAAGRFDDGGVLVDLALAFGGLDHADADAVLDRPERGDILELYRGRGLGVTDHAPQLYERRLADRLRDAVVNPSAKRLRHGNNLRFGKSVP